MKAVGLLSAAWTARWLPKCYWNKGLRYMQSIFTSPFCLCTPKNAGCAAVVKAVEELGQVGLKRVALGDEYLHIVQHPRHGYGSGLNPCLDCRIMKIRKAGEYMREIGASFILPGRCWDNDQCRNIGTP